MNFGLRKVEFYMSGIYTANVEQYGGIIHERETATRNVRNSRLFGVEGQKYRRVRVNS